jgi:hypothetical protein
MTMDPGVELLPDVPISGPDEDVLARGPVVTRLVELACAQPLAAPRVVALVGGDGAGKTSVLRLAVAQLLDRGDVACVSTDAAEHADASAVIAAVLAHLTEFFSEAGVVDTADSVRDKLAHYGGMVSSVARLAGVKVDVEGALKRSPEDVRAEIAEMTQEVGKRIVIVLDHLDRLPGKEVGAALVALRHLAAIPYVSIILAVDRRGLFLHLPKADVDPAGFQRLVQVELSVPPPDRVLLARVVAGGLARAGARLGRDIDSALELFDPDAEGLALELIESPRDAKRAANALIAALPLLPDGDALHDACLELLVRLLVPVLDSPRLDACHRDGTIPAARQARLAELEATVAGHRHGAAARLALRELFEAEA